MTLSRKEADGERSRVGGHQSLKGSGGGSKSMYGRYEVRTRRPGPTSSANANWCQSFHSGVPDHTDADHCVVHSTPNF